MKFHSAAIALTLCGAVGAATTGCATRTDGEPAPSRGFFSGSRPDSIDPTLALSADAGADSSTGSAAPAWQVGTGRPMPVVHKLYTEHLGEWLRDEPTHSASFGLLGADIGLSLRQFGQQVFFFGDSFAANPAMENTKTVATIPLGPPPDVLDLPKLVFPLDSTGVFTPVSLPGLSFGALTVPWGSIALGDSTYVYYAAAWDPTTQTQTQSALAHTQDGAFTSMQLDYDVPSTHFIGVQALDAGDDVLLFGEGPYRQSALYLAMVDKTNIANHSAWRYFAGQGDAGCPTFSSSEADAVPIIPSDCIGEFSVMRSFELGGYVVTYNCFDTNERGIFMQMAPTPLGPWSAPVKILDPEFDSYTKFIHATAQAIGFDDGLSDWGRETTFGFEYAPNLVPEWTRVLAPGVFSIVYTLSSWNPYTLHLVHTVVGVDGTSASPTPRGVGLPKATLVNGNFGTGDLTGWTASGDPFVVLTAEDGSHFVTTFGAKGAAGVGQISQDFVVDSTTSELVFAVTGGDAVVELLHDGDMVRSTHGPGSNTTPLTAGWNIAEFQGQKVTLLILDNVTDPFGFINVSPFVLQ